MDLISNCKPHHAYLNCYQQPFNRKAASLISLTLHLKPERGSDRSLLARGVIPSVGPMYLQSLADSEDVLMYGGAQGEGVQHVLLS